MPKRVTPLTTVQVRSAKPGRYGMGGGLYLLVRESGAAYWLFRYHDKGRRMREMGLGPARGDNAVRIADARDKAAALRLEVRGGASPADAGAASRVPAGQVTFSMAAADMIAAREAGWRNPKHKQQWRNTLAAHAEPVFGAKPVAEVTTEDVLAALQPIWTKLPETASRLRGRIERVLAFAAGRGWRPRGDNPAAWRGHLSEMLPAPGAMKRAAGSRHQPALPWEDLPAFLAALRARPAEAARALEFLILTAARTGEVLGMRWAEVDLDKALWTVPASRMKGARAHEVPLQPAAIALLQAQREGQALAHHGRAAPYVFGGAKPLSQMALLMLLRRMNGPDAEGKPRWRDGRTGEAITAHGFRSTFRDWAGETTPHPREVVEMALAHALRDKVEAAYARGPLLAKRRALMDDWAAYCARQPAEPVALHGRRDRHGA